VIDFILSFLGVTFMYAGMLMISQDVVMGIGSAIVGFILTVRPFIRFIRFARATFGTALITQSYRNYEREMAKGHSRQDGDKKPTYH